MTSLLGQLGESKITPDQCYVYLVDGDFTLAVKDDETVYDFCVGCAGT